MNNKVCVVVGLQWGDEGKGKIIDLISKRFSWSARFGGGPNAGHTVYIKDNKVVFHHIPCAVSNNKTKAIIGQGVVIDLDVLKSEVEHLEKLGINIKNNLFISDRSHIIMPHHKLEDKSEHAKMIGTTACGVGPVYKDKASRISLRISDFVNQDFNRFKDFYKYKNIPNLTDPAEEVWKCLLQNIEFFSNNITDVTILLKNIIYSQENLLIECAHGTMLDIDFGTYPFVTSSSTTLCGVNAGLGIVLNKIDEICGIMKSYTTRVGTGPFVAEDRTELGKLLQQKGNEFGSTTGRPRRCGWLDFVALKFAVSLNNVSYIALTKLDVLNGFREIPVLVSYKLGNKIIEEYPSSIHLLEKVEGVYKVFEGWGNVDFKSIKNYNHLPKNLLKYIDFIEYKLGVPVNIISYGIQKDDVIIK